MKVKPVFTYKKCMVCGICIQACPVSCMTLSKMEVDSYGKAYPLLGKGCIGCGICENECPYEAVSVQ